MGSWRVAAGEALTTLRNSPLRTLLSTFGVLVGIGALAVILSLGAGLEALMREEEAQTQDPHLIRVTPEVTEFVNGVTVPRARVLHLTLAHLDSVESVVGTPVASALRVHSMERVEVEGANVPIPSQVRLVSAGYFEVQPVTRVAGRLDLDGAIVNESFASHLGVPVEGALGRIVRRGDLAFPISGVIAATRPAAPPQVVLPLEQAFITDGGSAPATLLVRVADTTQRRFAVQALRRWVEEGFGPGAADVSAAGQSYQRSIGQIRVVKYLVGAIAGIAVISGAIGIMNIMLASVLERTREIGIRMACGARRRDIRRQFLLESMVVSLAGAMVGVILGFGLASLIFLVLKRTMEAALPAHAALPPLAFLGVVALAALAGVLAGWYPAGRAARLTPSEAMRIE